MTLALTKEEAAEELRIGVTTLDRLIASGAIMVIHYEEGMHPRIPRSELERFVKERLEEARARWLAQCRSPLPKPDTPRTRVLPGRSMQDEVEKVKRATKRR